MPVYILIAVGAILFVIWIGVKLKKSLKFGEIVKDITEEPILNAPKTNEMIKDIGAVEKALQAKANAQAKEAEKLQNDSNMIGDYLTGKNNNVKPTNGKEAETDKK